MALIVPLLLAGVAAWSLALGFLQRTWTARVQHELEAATRVLSEGGLPLTLPLLERLASLQRAEFALLDAQGRILLSTFDVVTPALADTLRSAAGSAPVARRAVLSIDGVPHVVVVQPLARAADPRYRAVVGAASLADARRAVADSARRVGAAMLAAGLVLAAILYWLVRGITAPLGKVAAMADRIASGSRNERLRLDRSDEIGALARAIDRMADRLTDYETQLASRARMAAFGEFAARAAHEIRNPLTGIKMHLQLLQERASAGDAERIARLLAEVRRLELVVAATLAVGRDRPLSPTTVDLRALIAEVAQLMEPALAHRHLALDLRLAELPPVRADADRLKQVVLNLLVNAADAQPDGGRIRIALERPAAGGCSQIAVEDAGPGIPPERRRQVFDGAASAKPLGLGLGLSLSREILQEHGGDLRAESSADLGGARFVAELPDARPS